MDPLRQSLALHIGLLAIDGIEARTQCSTAQRDAADLRTTLSERDAEVDRLRKELNRAFAEIDTATNRALPAGLQVVPEPDAA